MSRYIDADALLKGHEDHELISTHLIWNASTADVEPVRHGPWINDIGYAGWTCSECGDHEGNKTDKYCPNCGARMDGEEQEHDN